MTHGNTLLKDDEIEKLTLLRMNKEFMKFMRKNYSHLTKQQFNIFGYSSVNFLVNRSSVRFSERSIKFVRLFSVGHWLRGTGFTELGFSELSLIVDSSEKNSLNAETLGEGS